MPFSNKIVWITGASSGIGEALAKELSRKGATLVLSARRVNRLERVLRHCDGDDHMVLPLDVTHSDSHQAAFDAILDRFGRLDILIINAGIGQRGSIRESGLEIERRVMEVNFFGCTSLTHVTLPHFLERGSGHYVVMSSVMGKISTPRRATYSASKHALHGYYEGLRAELHETDIAITLLCPGYVKTEISRHSLIPSGIEHGKMDAQHIEAMTAAVFAKKAIRVIARKKAIAFIGGAERFGPLVERIFPGLYRFLIPRVMKRE